VIIEGGRVEGPFETIPTILKEEDSSTTKDAMLSFITVLAHTLIQLPSQF
jgi:hypothetical protein